MDPINGDGVFIVKPEVLEAMLPEEKRDRLMHLQEDPASAFSTLQNSGKGRRDAGGGVG